MDSAPSRLLRANRALVPLAEFRGDDFQQRVLFIAGQSFIGADIGDECVQVPRSRGAADIKFIVCSHKGFTIGDFLTADGR